MTRYKMFASGIASADAMATFDVAVTGELVGVSWVIRVEDAAAAASGQFELSLSSANSFTANDTRSQISGCAYAVGGVILQNAINYYEPIPGFRLNAGERIFLHHLVDTAADDVDVTIFLWVDDKAPTPGGGRRL